MCIKISNVRIVRNEYIVGMAGTMIDNVLEDHYLGFWKLVFWLGLIKFIIDIREIVNNVLQLDFSCMYVAGKAMALGLSPYVNYYYSHRELWDGCASTPYSRWLYPPITADLFRPISALSYQTAKIIWTIIIILALIMAIYIVVRSLKIKMDERRWLILGTAVFWFFPLYALLERGQIDSICLLLLATGLSLVMGKNKARGIFGGAIIALSAMIKLHCAFILIFLILRRKWLASVGFMAGVILLGIISIKGHGLGMNISYITKELPRIASSGPEGNERMRFPEFDKLWTQIKNTGEEHIHKQRLYPYYVNYQGKEYDTMSGQYNVNASAITWVRIISGRDINYAKISILIMGLIVVTIGYYEYKGRTLFKELKLYDEWCFVSLGFITIMLAAPLTWVMNSVWLLVLIPLFFAECDTSRNSTRHIGWSIVLCGFILQGFADPAFIYRRIVFLYILSSLRTILCYLLCLIGMLIVLYGPIIGKGKNKCLEGNNNILLFRAIC